MLDAASSLAVTAVFQARGHAELDDRVDRAYERFVVPRRQSFKLCGRPARLSNVVKFNWEMVTDGGDGRISRDHQFVES